MTGIPLPPLRVRLLGRVTYREAFDLQTMLVDRRARGHDDDWLLLLEHPPTYTLGRRADPAHLLATAAQIAAVGADVVNTNRGGDVTYHGPGQLVAYPILRLGDRLDVVAHVRNLEEIVLRFLADFGVVAHREDGLTGVWTDAGKIAAIGCRVTRGVTMHGVALNVDVDMSYWRLIVPCGLHRPVISMAELPELAGAVPSMQLVAERFVIHAADVFGRMPNVAGQLWAAQPSSERPMGIVSSPGIRDQVRKRPAWVRNRARLFDRNFMALKTMMQNLDLHTVCEEASCPNIYDCWSERTATLMLLGSHCTRSCGFCGVETARPLPVDFGEPERAAAAVGAMGLQHAVLTSPTRDDLPDGGAAIFAATICAIRRQSRQCTVEVLVPDFKGDADAAATVFDARPDVFNHNVETVARLQRAVRPQAGYARSLTLLARAKTAGLVTKSGLVAGLGETEGELREAIGDLAAVGVDILTLGQYLRPSGQHLPVDRWLDPAEFRRLRDWGFELGFAHVEAGPLVRSSYRARFAAKAIGPQAAGQPAEACS